MPAKSPDLATGAELLLALETQEALYPKLNVKWKKEDVKQGSFDLYMHASKPKKVVDDFTSGVKDLTNDLYHGSSKESIKNIRKHGIDLSKTKKQLDFNTSGKGAFYVSDNLKDTKNFMKWKKKKVFDQEGLEIETDFIKFKISPDDLKKLDIKVFEKADDDWIEFVTSARNGTLKHSHDFVIGPKLANPLQMKVRGDGDMIYPCY